MRKSRLFIRTAALLLLACSHVLAAGSSSIVVDTVSLTATVSIQDGDDLLNMPSFSFKETNNEGDTVTNSAIYTKSKATSRRMDSGARETIWEGLIMDKGHVGFATFVLSPLGGFAGTISTDVATFTLTTMSDNTIQVRKSLWEDELKTGDPDDAMEENDEIINQHMDRFSSLKASGNSAIEATSITRLDTSGSIETSIGEASNVVRPTNDRTRMLRGGEQRSLKDGPEVDVLVLITNRAMCESSKQSYGCQATESNRAALESMIPLLQTQSTNAMQGVGVAASIRIVGVVHLHPSYDYTPGPEAANVIRTDSNIQAWRDEYGADLVNMITGPGGSYGGWAYYNSFASTVSWTQLSYYTFTHELGHSFGCYHNRANTVQRHAWAHGLQVPGVLRTIMAYSCSSSSCPRIPLFSANGEEFDGTPLGDSDHDCAREIALNAAEMSEWRSATKNEPFVPPRGTIPTPNNGTPPSGGNAKTCFSSANTVEVQGKGLVAIDSLRIGDYVLARKDTYSRVYSFSHIDREIVGDYLQIHANGLEKPLEVSPEHMVFVDGVAIRASEVKVHDHLGKSTVSKIIPVKRRGAYAPVTESGDLVVSGVLASSYAALLDYSPVNQHTAAHAVFAPHRLTCSFRFQMCENETYTDGRSNWIYSVIRVVRRLNEHSALVQVFATLLAVPLMAAMYLLEQIIKSSLLMATVGVAIIMYKNVKASIRSKHKSF